MGCFGLGGTTTGCVVGAAGAGGTGTLETTAGAGFFGIFGFNGNGGKEVGNATGGIVLGCFLMVGNVEVLVGGIKVGGGGKGPLCCCACTVLFKKVL